MRWWVAWLVILLLVRDTVLGRFSFVQSVRTDQPVLKWNARVLRTGSGQNGSAHGSSKARELGELCSQAVLSERDIPLVAEQ